MPSRYINKEILDSLLSAALAARGAYDAAICAISEHTGFDSDELGLTDDDLVEMDVDELLELIREVEAEG